jgi:hypothetical protein
VQGVLDGQILIPSIMGKTVGLRPLVALAAVLIGASLFGFLGIILILPVVGVVQMLILSAWQTWQAQQPEQFPEVSAAESGERARQRSNSSKQIRSVCRSVPAASLTPPSAMD